MSFIYKYRGLDKNGNTLILALNINFRNTHSEIHPTNPIVRSVRKLAPMC